MSTVAQEIIVTNKPSGFPEPTSTFKVQPISTPPSSATPGHILLRLKVVSVDPYLRGVLRSAQVGEPLTSWAVAEVVDSQHEAFSRGDLVTGRLPWRTVQLHDGAGMDGAKLLTKLQPSPHIPLTAYVGVLGMPGRTAYFGLLDHEVGRFQPGQTVVVSGAAGAVGSLVGQLARIKGAKRVIGTAGGPEKCRLVKERYGFDECIDYKAVSTVEAMTSALQAAAPDGVDLYFDNTSGHVTQAMFDVYNTFGRMALCGAISGYNADPKEDLIPSPLSAASDLCLCCILEPSIRRVAHTSSHCVSAQWAEVDLQTPQLQSVRRRRLQRALF